MSDSRGDAIGSGALVRTYEVRFTYVEPSYARSRGIEERPYGARFTVRARTPEQAIAAARAAFDRAAAESSVMWLREIVDATCQLVEDEVALAG